MNHRERGHQMLFSKAHLVKEPETTPKWDGGSQNRSSIPSLEFTPFGAWDNKIPKRDLA